MKKDKAIPIPVKRLLFKLGQDIHNARLRRRISTIVTSERVGICRATLLKVERGCASVSLGIYAAVLFVLGLINNLEKVADISNDMVGQTLDEENLPKRIRYSKQREL